MLTEAQAAEKGCFQAFNSLNTGATCVGSRCMAWRYRPHPADDQWIDAVRKAAEELGDATPNRAKAAKHVSQNREKYGLPIVPTHGWCGLAGRPE